jgi:outer membrane protein TolC
MNRSFRILAAAILAAPLLLRKAQAQAVSLPQETTAKSLFSLSLSTAETKTLARSDALKAYLADQQAATESAGAQFASVLPRLDFDGSYDYVTNVPRIQISPAFPAFPFGTHNNWNVGPMLSYTLWDTGSAWKQYSSLTRLAQSREEDRRQAELQILLAVRAAYVNVQLALEEMRLVNDSLSLSRSQNKDIESNYQAGAASRLDRVESQRAVINYQLQFLQSQADLSSTLKDLLALVGEVPENVSRPGPPGVENVGLELKLDSLDESLDSALRLPLMAPDEGNPQIKSQELQAQSAELSAQSQKAALFPVLQASAKATEQYPNAILPETIQQNTFALSLALPLFEGNRTHHQVEEKLKEAESARHRAAQLRTDLGRDFWKAKDMLDSLTSQRALAVQDVKESEDAARLYYESYKLGKINLTDVQAADVRELQAKVEAAGIAARALQQIIVLRSLSAEETNYAQ